MLHTLHASLAVLGSFLIVGCATTDADTSHRGPATPEAMMEAMMQAGTPGEGHRRLDPFVGTWDGTVTMWMDPTAPPEVSKGRMVTSWILDGRFLEQQFTGDFGGQPFSGTSNWGYDVAAEKYVSTWVDSMSTSIAYSTGEVSADGKKFTLQMDSTDPMSGERVRGETVVTIDSKDRNTMVMYDLSSGSRVKSMEIAYTRVR